VLSVRFFPFREQTPTRTSSYGVLVNKRIAPYFLLMKKTLSPMVISVLPLSKKDALSKTAEKTILSRLSIKPHLPPSINELRPDSSLIAMVLPPSLNEATPPEKEEIKKVIKDYV